MLSSEQMLRNYGIMCDVKNNMEEQTGERREKLPLAKGYTAADDVKAVMKQYNLPARFPKTVQQEARRIGKPKSQRAVGGANNANPLCIVVPCHRVINSDGKIGGYASGSHIKQALLDLEARNKP